MPHTLCSFCLFCLSKAIKTFGEGHLQKYDRLVFGPATCSANVLGQGILAAVETDGSASPWINLETRLIRLVIVVAILHQSDFQSQEKELGIISPYRMPNGLSEAEVMLRIRSNGPLSYLEGLR